MEKCPILFVLAIILVQSFCQDDAPLKVTFLNPADRYVTLNSGVNLDFEVNRGPVFALGNKVQMIRKSFVDGGEQVSELTQAGNYLEAEPEFYFVQVDTSAGTDKLIIRFKILKVRDIDDAIYECRVTAGDVVESSALNVFVLRANTKLEMKFHESAAFLQSMTQPFEVDAGKYKVMCNAEGSNPATDNLKIYWAGVEIKTGNIEKVELNTPLRSYSSKVMGEVDVKVMNSGQDIECVAVSRFGDRLTTKAPIKVNVYDPVVDCTQGEAFVGQRYPKLTCIVDAGTHDILSYAFKSGKTGEVINEGEQNNNFDVVKKTDLDNNHVKVELIIHRVTDPHFSEYYLIIRHRNGHISRESVVLSEVESPNDSSSMLAASLTTLVLCAVCALWRSL